MLQVMHDYKNIHPIEKPLWGPFGSWMWWTWKQLEPQRGQYRWDMVDQYLSVAYEMDKPVSLSMIVYPGPNQDGTPGWVYTGGLQPHVGYLPQQDPLAEDPRWEFEREIHKKYRLLWVDDAVGLSMDSFVYPAWNTLGWDSAFRAFVTAFGEQFDGDPRIDSVWIATLLYGETVVTMPGGGQLGNNPMRFVWNAMDWYREAFPNTTLHLIGTGSVDRRKNTERALELGIFGKYNALRHDLPNHHQPYNASGLLDVAKISIERGLPTAWEHFYSGASPGEGVWAMYTAIAHNATLVDLPVQHLDTLASIKLPFLGNTMGFSVP